MRAAITGLQTTARFDAELKSAPREVQLAASEVLKLLMQTPPPQRLRVHALKGYGKPTLFKVDVFTNHSWQLTFELVGSTAVLRRLAQHKTIDRDPRG